MAEPAGPDATPMLKVIRFSDCVGGTRIRYYFLKYVYLIVRYYRSCFQVSSIIVFHLNLVRTVALKQVELVKCGICPEYIIILIMY